MRGAQRKTWGGGGEEARHSDTGLRSVSRVRELHESRWQPLRPPKTPSRTRGACTAACWGFCCCSCSCRWASSTTSARSTAAWTPASASKSTHAEPNELSATRTSSTRPMSSSSTLTCGRSWRKRMRRGRRPLPSCPRTTTKRIPGST